MFGLVAFSVVAIFFVLLLTVKAERTRARVAQGFLALVLGGLTLAGALAIATGLFEFVAGREGGGQLAVQLLAGGLFAGVGGRFFHVVFVAAPLARARLERRKARHPDAPWMWLEEWAGGRLHYSPGRQVQFAWVVLLVLSGSLLSLSYVNREDVLSRLQAAPLEVIAFYAISCGILFLGFVAAVRLLRGARAFGGSTLVLSTPCGVVGGQLTGTVHTRMREAPASGFELRLRCRRPLAQSPGPRREIRIWAQDQEVSPGQAQAGPTGLAIPVAFPIPASVPESDAWSAGTRVEWVLSAAASAGGRAYYSEFLVPVFRPRAAGQQAGIVSPSP